MERALTVSNPAAPTNESRNCPAWRSVEQVLGAEYLSAATPARLEEFALFVTEANQIGHDPAGPVREVQSLVGDRWSGLLLPLLHFGPLRFSMVQRIVGLADAEPISRRMLSYKLRALERDGFVKRTVHQDAAQRVDYSLTPLGEGFYPVLTRLIHWLHAHNAEIEAARRVFERQDTDLDLGAND
jgi:DNA-binding HxlR family transcriptional regulator